MVPERCLHIAEPIHFMIDASNFENSTFWDPDTTSGIGGWGDPNDDYQITDGGFAVDFPLSYPSPHTLRRSYTPTSPNWPGPLVDTFTPASTMAMVNDFVGTFVGFQEFFEPGSHAAIHRIVSGCVDLLSASCIRPLTGPLQGFSGDLPFHRSC